MTDKENDDKTTTVINTDTDSDTEPEVESFHDALESLALGGDNADNACDHIVTPGGDNYNDKVNGVSGAGCSETQKDDSVSDNVMQDAEENHRMTDSDNDEADEVTVDEQAILDRESQMTLEERQDLRDAAQKLKGEGNTLFKASEFTCAIKTYSEALDTCPRCFHKERSIMFSNRAAAHLRLEKHESAIADCSEAIKLNPTYLKAIMRRAELYEKTDKLDEALEDYKKTLELDPSQHVARFACMRLPDQIKERNEKLKDEMLGKLKELGNMVLKPFGLSTNNFQLQQDPNTGSYSVNFSQGGKS